jgi:hypothetical protein
MHTELPNAYCYLVAPGLIAGEYPGAWERNETIAKITHFLDVGVSFFLDLTQPGELIPYADLLAAEAATRSLTVIHRRMPIRDLSTPQTARMMSDILDAIDAARTESHTVYVHCWGGVGRTGTVIGCWLVRHGMSGDEALATIARHWEGMPADKRARRPRSPETDAQRAYVRNWRE